MGFTKLNKGILLYSRIGRRFLNYNYSKTSVPNRNELLFCRTYRGISISSQYMCTHSVRSRDWCRIYSNFHHHLSRFVSESSSCCQKHLYDFRRGYSKKHKASHSDSEDSDEEDLNDVLDKYDKSSQVIKTHLTSMRLDTVLKSALGQSRNKIDTAFYESRIRLNGERVLKKSQRLSVGDEIDLIKTVSPVNPDILTVARVEILSAKVDEDEEEISIRMRRFKSLQVENYENAPYKQESKQGKS